MEWQIFGVIGTLLISTLSLIISITIAVQKISKQTLSDIKQVNRELEEKLHDCAQEKQVLLAEKIALLERVVELTREKNGAFR